MIRHNAKCPFCGSKIEATVIATESVGDGWKDTFCARCQKCDSRGPDATTEARSLAAFSHPAHIGALLRECRNRIASDCGSESPCCEGVVTGKGHTEFCDKFDLLSRIDSMSSALVTDKQLEEIVIRTLGRNVTCNFGHTDILRNICSCSGCGTYWQSIAVAHAIRDSCEGKA